MNFNPTGNSSSPIAPVARLMAELHKLPGIGPKNAQRLTYHLVSVSNEEALALAKAIQFMKEQTILCSECMNITDRDPCSICSDQGRDKSCICVVEEPLDVLALEHSRAYHGLYHVLHGAISPGNGIGPDELRIRELLVRLEVSEKSYLIGHKIQEIVLATNPNLEGEATAMYLHRILSPWDIRVTHLARGLTTGGELQYTDETTLVRSFQGRQEF